MNDNIVKIVDENNISREAKIITKFTENGLDYVIYTINRDNENANIFVSRLVNDVDGIKFADIIDINEKAKIDAIVKDMIKKAME